ncbi:6116_t:CDS:2 [Paraglomus brasilianum]|uniref:6116_t:CDS:1 n=1 Tax=Paraglomus brasilianum TaxID=144538 RepID=A0A9N9D3P3_9GLOM|nr:6116_t:CDS:2 [Paraglomus brasilianum]
MVCGRRSCWNDPRFPAVRGIRRRGLTVEALRHELQLHLEGDFRKTNKKITWLADTVKVKLVDYYYLINKKKLAENDDVKDFLTAKTEFLDETIADGNVMASSDDIRLIRIPDGKASNVASKAK